LNTLGAVREVRPEPLNDGAADTKGHFQAMKQNFMIDCVERCRQVSQNEHSDIALVNGVQKVGHDSQHGCFR
jgi:hypothetical protein